MNSARIRHYGANLRESLSRIEIHEGKAMCEAAARRMAWECADYLGEIGNGRSDGAEALYSIADALALRPAAPAPIASLGDGIDDEHPAAQELAVTKVGAFRRIVSTNAFFCLFIAFVIGMLIGEVTSR
jgi:hypothetical protein